MLKVLHNTRLVGFLITFLMLAGVLLSAIIFPDGLSFIFLGISIIFSIALLQLLLWANLRQHFELLTRRVDSVQAQLSLTTLRLQQPTFLLNHSVASDILILMGEFIRRFPIHNILELGSGASSVYLATMLEQFRQQGTLISLEDGKAWQELVQSELDKALAGSSVAVQVLFAPLSSHSSEFNEEVLFYSLPSYFDNHPKFDMIFVDGPSNVRFRDKALELLAPYFAEECIIVWDDSEQDVIRSRVATFVASHPEWSLKYYNTIKGTSVMYRLNCELPLP